MRCEKCGERIYPRDKYCRECGTTVLRELEDDDEFQTMDMAPSEKFSERRPPPPPPPRVPGYIPPPGENVCRTCGGRLKHMRQYDRYWCERCQKYAPLPGEAEMAPGKAKAAFGIAALFSILGGLLLLFTNFGGWWYYSSTQRTDVGAYGTFYYYDSVSGGEVIGLFSEPEYGAIIIPVALAMFVCGAIAMQGFRGRKPLTKKKLKVASALALAAFLIAVIAAAVMFIEVEDANVWLGPGFYGAALGGLISFVALTVTTGKID